MALSGFIKQLLETDSVFSSEAKKFTGINDANNITTITSENVFNDFLVSLTVTSDRILVSFPNFAASSTEALPEIDIIRPGGLVKFVMSNVDIDIPEEQVTFANLINGFVLRVEEITYSSNSGTPTATFSCSRTGGNAAELISIEEENLLSNFGPMDMTFDTRIASTISDAHIATYASNGSTMFNLDNNSPRDKQDAGAGVASKYAAHYHGEKQIHVVTNFRDPENNPLFRLESKLEALDDDVGYGVYNADNAATYVDTQPSPLNPNIRVTYQTGDKTTTVAEYGNIGSPGVWRITLKGVPTATTYDVDDNVVTLGTSMLVNGTSPPFVGVFAFFYGLRKVDETGFRRQWPVFIPQNATDTEQRIYRTIERLTENWNESFEEEFGIANMFDLEIEGGFTDDEVTLVATSNDRDADINKILISSTADESLLSVVKSKTAVTPVAVTGNKFITFNDLLNRLREAESEFDIAIAISGNRTLSFTTTDLETTLINFIQPQDVSNIFETVTGNELVNIAIGGLITQTIEVDAEPVFDSLGSVVFSNDRSTLEDC